MPEYKVQTRAYHNFVARFLQDASESSPRGIPTKEVIGASLIVRNPVDRIITDKARKINIAFGFAEWFAILYGIDSIKFFEMFVSDYGKYSTDGEHLDGAYGSRIVYEHYDPKTAYAETRNQIEAVTSRLDSDRDSRQAVISIYGSEDLYGAGGKNTPCTLSLQFILRNSVLHCITTMRSNDIIRGFTYDLLVFSLIQELIATRLGVGLGEYVHNVGSLHMYDTDMAMVETFGKSPRWPFKMNTMPAISLETIRSFRPVIDNVGKEDFFLAAISQPVNSQTKYLLNMAYAMQAFAIRRTMPSLSKSAYSQISDTTIKHCLRPWIVRRSAGV